MSRRDHTAHDLASLRIDLFGETSKSSSTLVFGRKPRGTIDKRGNVLATAPFMKRKRKMVEMGNSTQVGPGGPTVSDIKDGALDSGRPRKKKRTYYPGVLPFLDIAGGAGNTVHHPVNGQPNADLLKRIHRFACEYYSDRGMLYDAFQGLRSPNHRSNSRRLKDNGDTVIIEAEPAPAADTFRDRDETGTHRDGDIETARGRTTVNSLHKNMFRAFDGTALITIGMLLQDHITSFLQRPPMDSNKWEEILLEENEKENKQHEWKLKRSKPRKDRQQATDKTPEESSASDSGGDDIGTEDGDNDDNDNGGTDEGDSLNEDEEVEEVVMVDHDSSGASSGSKAR